MQGGYVASPDTVRKIVFLGDAGVGKTSLINRLVSNSSSKPGPTVGAAEHLKQIFLT